MLTAAGWRPGHKCCPTVPNLQFVTQMSENVKLDSLQCCDRLQTVLYAAKPPQICWFLLCFRPVCT